MVTVEKGRIEGISEEVPGREWGGEWNWILNGIRNNIISKSSK